MKKTIIILLLAGTVLGMGGWFSEAQAWVRIAIGPPALSVLVPLPPPPTLNLVVPPPPPLPGLVWTPGYWSWNGTAYVWSPGVWVRAPHPRAFWVSGHWVPTRHGWHWRPGHWR